MAANVTTAKERHLVLKGFLIFRITPTRFRDNFTRNIKLRKERFILCLARELFVHLMPRTGLTQTRHPVDSCELNWDLWDGEESSAEGKAAQTA